MIEPKTGNMVTGLQAADFTFHGKTPRRVESVEFSKDVLDVTLLLDNTSLMGEMVQPMADDLDRAAPNPKSRWRWFHFIPPPT